MKRKLFASNTINSMLRKLMVKSSVCSVFLWDARNCEEWWNYLGVDTVGNEYVFRWTSCLFKRVQRRRNTWIGHILRHYILLAITYWECYVQRQHFRGSWATTKEEVGCRRLKRFAQDGHRRRSTTNRYKVQIVSPSPSVRSVYLKSAISLTKRTKIAPPPDNILENI